MERFREIGNRLKKLCGDYAHGTFIVGLTLTLALWGGEYGQSAAEIFIPPAAIWAITGNPYGFFAGYFAFDILGDFWDPTVPESMLLGGITSLVTICGVAARVGKLSWRGIIRNWLNSLPEDNDTSASTDMHQASPTVLKIVGFGLFFAVIFGLNYLSSAENSASSKCYNATHQIYRHAEVEPFPWWIPETENLPTQEGMEELKELTAQLEKDPEAGTMLEAWETACRDEIAEKTSKSSSGR